GYQLCLALVLAARQSAGDANVTDTMVDDALAVAAAESKSTALELRRLERRARKLAALDRGEVIGELEALAHAVAGSDLAAIDRARLHFLRASLCEDDPETRD